jgi:hypothetical protein
MYYTYYYIFIYYVLCIVIPCVGKCFLLVRNLQTVLYRYRHGVALAFVPVVAVPSSGAGSVENCNSKQPARAPHLRKLDAEREGVSSGI